MTSQLGGQGDAEGLIFAADTAGDGYITRYTSDKPTVGLQIPVAGNQAPPRMVSHEGGCTHKEMRNVGDRECVEVVVV